MKCYQLKYALLLLLFVSCKNNKDNSATGETAVEAKTPVTLTRISTGPMEEYIELNATSSYLQKWMVRANATGYLQAANVQLNAPVSRGQLLYTVKTKEAQSIGNSINILDSSFKFSGINSIRANGSGFISQIIHQGDDYVQDGDVLAEITDIKSFVFLMDMPYELKPYVTGSRNLQLILPDGEQLLAVVTGSLPSMDAASQTQRIILKVNNKGTLPENLIAKVMLVKSFKGNTSSLPKAAVLTDETQSEYWVMKLLNDSTAVKVPITKGLETNDKIEILSPVFSAADKIILTGNYGLTDSAAIKMIKE